MSILSYLGFGGDERRPDSAETETVRKIVNALDAIEPERARYIAAFAYIMSRAARSDLKVTPEETRMMERIVEQRAGLPPEHAVLTVQIAKSQSLLFGATENFLVTREFGRIATREEKLALLDCLFAVAAAEGGISVKEDNEIRQISDELGLEHREYIAVRSGYREHLSVLKRPEQ